MEELITSVSELRYALDTFYLLISGVLVSTALTLVLVPLLYFLYVRAVGTASVVELDSAHSE